MPDLATLNRDRKAAAAYFDELRGDVLGRSFDSAAERAEYFAAEALRDDTLAAVMAWPGVADRFERFGAYVNVQRAALLNAYVPDLHAIKEQTP